MYQNQVSEYSITIATIDTKINSAGIAQCSNYAKTSVSDQAFSSYGLSLIDVLATANHSSAKYFINESGHEFNHLYLDIEIENHLNEKINYDSILSDQLTKAFQFKLITLDSLIDGFELEVIDTEKLQMHEDSCMNGSVKNQGKTWEMRRSKLNTMIYHLNRFSKFHIHDFSANQQCYSLAFIIDNDMQTINTHLQAFGLALTPIQFQQTFYTLIENSWLYD